MTGNESLAHRYKEVAINTANPLQLVVMLYDAAIHSLQEARNHIRKNNIAGRSQSLNRCISIISELQTCLNHKEGGEIAGSLDRLYDYMKRRIFRANVDQSVQPLDEIERLLFNLHSAWKELVEKSPRISQQPKQPQFANHRIMGTGSNGDVPNKSFNISI